MEGERGEIRRGGVGRGGDWWLDWADAWGWTAHYVSSFSLHFYIQGHYQNYNLQLYKATNTNRDTINEVCLVLATVDINTPCMHPGVKRLV